MAKWKRPKFAGFRHTPPDRRAALDEAKERAAQLLERGLVDEALLQLEEIVTNFPDDADLLMMLGTCHFVTGEPDAALVHYERAYALSKQPEILYPLGMVYLQLAMLGSALHAFTESVRRGLPLPEEIQSVLPQLRENVSAVADRLRLPLEKAVIGLREMERGMRWLDRNDYRRAVEASRAAIKVLGAWPPPHNNLALALFFDGQPAQAIAESRGVLAHEPENLMAAANLVRFLVWTGERAAAEEVWRTLHTRDPLKLPDDALKLAETAAILEDDESVRRFLLPLASSEPEQVGGWRHYLQVQQFLATAEANLGNPKAAKRRLRALDAESAGVQALRDALRDGQKGFGLTGRFSYFRSIEVLPLARLEEFMELAADAAEGDDPKAGNKLKEFVARFPQLVLVGEKLIWEENAAEPGIFLLRSVGTPAAHAALRRFAGSQAGSDEDRSQALLALQISGGAQPGETFTIWHDGAWLETQLRSFTIYPRYEQTSYKANVVKLIEDGQAAAHAKRWAEAIALLRKATELEPKAYEAFNNLAAALSASGDHEASKAMLERALAIKPDYVHARVNLALKLVNQDVDAAAAMLAPLEGRTTFAPKEFTLYQLGLAHVALTRDQFDAARDFLQMALTVDPEYEPAAALLAHIDAAEFSQHKGNLWERLRDLTVGRNARYRQRQQRKLATLTPTLDDALRIYSTELLRTIAQAMAPAQRLTGLRKADLQRIVRETLLDAASLRLVVERLSEPEWTALAAVLAAGGAMPQGVFRAAYGDDGDESPWWSYQLPQSVAGRLRLHGLLAETTVGGTVHLAVPVDLRAPLAAALGVRQAVFSPSPAPAG
jgi:tetratricopeptide (TPR) repeat protein